MLRKITFAMIPVILILLTWLTTGLKAQDRGHPDITEGYLTPPDNIAEEVLAPRHENVTLYNLDPDREYFLNTLEMGMTPLSYYAKPYYNLGGLQIDPQANRSRWMTTGSTTGLELIDARDGETREIQTLDEGRISNESWSPDGSKLAYYVHTEDATHLYVANLESGQSRRVTRRPILATLNTSYDWSADGRYIYVVLIPEGRGEAPVRPDTPKALQVRKTSNVENRLRTYQDLLEDPFEFELLEYFITGQLVRINVQNRSVHEIGDPAMIEDIDVAPSGEYAIVQTLQKPFSYIVPVYRFGWKEEIWDMDGNVMTELRHSVTNEGIPDSSETEDYGRSDIEWRPDGEGLSLMLEPEEDEENGDNQEEQEVDAQEEEEDVYKIIQWLPPFGEEDMNVVYENKREMQSVSYNQATDILFISEDRGNQEILYVVYTDDPDTSYTIYKHREDDFYEDPGNIMRKSGELGVPVVMISSDGENVFLEGTQYYENPTGNAPRPFIDRVNIQTGEKERIFQSSEEMEEDVRAALDDEITELVIERQSAEVLPDSWLYNIETGESTKLTDNTDFNEDITQAQRERFKVKRSDGFEFWVEVTLPRNWDGQPLPGIIWHYPSEYDDQEDYDEDQRDYNKNDFPGVYSRSMEILVKEGYSVIDADWPIAAERGGPNDGFVWSIVQNATAVIDSAAARGYIDRTRMAIGGHSYGAFGTANALIHTSFFKAGIAGDGNYNRTLTPMGFQREPNDLWRGLDRYLQMSPIFWADRLDGALLMYHGAMDQNVGTWPIHSKRMMHALNGIGKTAAMYFYPHEAHGPGARETILDLWTRWVDWLNHYVKERGGPVREAELHDE